MADTDQSSVPSLDLDAEDPYPEDDLEAATIEAMMKHNRRVERAFSSILELRWNPYDEETGEIRSFFDLVWESAQVRNVGSPPPHLNFEKRGRLWKDDIEDWAELPQVEVPIDYRRINLPKVLTKNVYSCRYCGYYTQRDDRILSHIRDKHPQVEGPLCIAREEADVVDPDDVDDQPITMTLSEFGIVDQADDRRAVPDGGDRQLQPGGGDDAE